MYFEILMNVENQPCIIVTQRCEKCLGAVTSYTKSRQGVKYWLVYYVEHDVYHKEPGSNNYL